MLSFSAAMQLLLLAAPAAFVSAAPASIPVEVQQLETRQSSSYWVSNIDRRGVVYNNTGYGPIFRNVKDAPYGAAGDGTTDDTNAINLAISAGGRCGLGCDSSTLTPAIIYFPPGTYKVSAPIVQYYFTQFIGDAINPPTLLADASFQGIAVIDSDPYEAGGANWYVNQNNFYRQVRNFIIDISALPSSVGAGIHWQVAQATSLQNITFNMNKDTSSANQQKGIFMDNGSGGFMSDLTFNGGGFGAWLGNQQFTTRNLVFNGCNTAFFMNWNWGWTLKSASINNCKVGIDMATSPANQSVGSLVVVDSQISNTPIGVNTSFTLNPASVPVSGGTLYLENVDMSNNVPTAIQGDTGSQILPGNTVIASWGQGSSYTGSSGSRVQAALSAPSKSASLMAGTKVFERSKPQYETVTSSSFISVISSGAVGDGNTDDTQAIQNVFDKIEDGQIVYFDHGIYRVTDTIKVPANVKMTGEIWPVIAANGSNFGDPTNPRPVFQIGQPGDSGAVEMSDMVFGNMGPAPGAVLIEWNLQSAQGASGMWDVHARVGGYNGTFQGMNCYHNENITYADKSQDYKTECQGVFTMMHITTSATGAYLENTWFWTADHSLDTGGSPQIDIYTGRGVLIESAGPTWLYGTASEHSVLYNYQLSGAKNIWMGMIQSETPYFQPNPVAPQGISGTLPSDPTFNCQADDTTCDAWGLRVINSASVFVYSGGLYSFFNNYGQDCLNDNPQDCQKNMVAIDSSSDVHLFALSTKASVNMITENDGAIDDAKDADNRGVFPAVVVQWTDGSSSNGPNNSTSPSGSSSGSSAAPASANPPASSVAASPSAASPAPSSAAKVKTVIHYTTDLKTAYTTVTA